MSRSAALVMFVALLVNSNVVQVGEAASLRANPHNVRVLYSEYSHQRGPIVVGGKEVAKSIPTNDALKYLRTYPGADVYAPVTGYYSLVVERLGHRAGRGPDPRRHRRPAVPEPDLRRDHRANTQGRIGRH